MRDCPGLIAELHRRTTNRKKKMATVANAAIQSDSSEEFQEADDELETEQEHDSKLDQIEAHLASTWYVDFGVSKHIAGDLAALGKLKSTGTHSSIRIADGKAYPVVGTGEASVNSSKDEIKFNKVLYVPDVKKNLLSVGKITDQNLGVYSNSSHFLIVKPPDIRKLGHIVASGTRDPNNGLYKLFSKVLEVFATISDMSTTLVETMSNVT